MTKRADVAPENARVVRKSRPTMLAHSEAESDAQAEASDATGEEAGAAEEGRIMAGERLKAMIATSTTPTPLGPVEKLRIAFDLHEAGVALMRQNLRRSHPRASAEEIGELLVAWLLRGHP